MFSETTWKQMAHSLKLSGQELHVVQGVFDDYTESAIANRLGISPHTVHTHCERLYRKLAVTDRVKLVLRIIDEFLVLTKTSRAGLHTIHAGRPASSGPQQRA
jgi:DNA-binding NarL/FixJ family response regulator